MNRMEFQAFLDLLMVSDPWPLDKQAQKILISYADNKSKEFGFENWIVAFHEMIVG